MALLARKCVVKPVVPVPIRHTGTRALSSRMALVLDATAKDNGGLILSALDKVAESIDILLLNLPTSLNEAEYIIRECYGYCLSKAANTDCTVYPFMPKKQYSTIYSNLKLEGLNTVPIEPVQFKKLTLKPAPNKPAKVGELGTVAVGGTFDHFHYGHKLLVTITALWCSTKLIVGITGPELLKNKKFAEFLDSYTKREHNVGAFVNSLFPKIQFDPHEINDMYGPTGTVPDIDGLVVSQETASGGKAVNDLRTSKGWKSLEVFEVGLIETVDGTDKVSSTQLREAQGITATKKL